MAGPMPRILFAAIGAVLLGCGGGQPSLSPDLALAPSPDGYAAAGDDAPGPRDVPAPADPGSPDAGKPDAGVPDAAPPDGADDLAGDDADARPDAPEVDPCPYPRPEECNGWDDDCNGQTDDGLGTTPCGTGICAREAPNCVAGEYGQCDPLLGATAETCNGLDDDCDGATDEDLGVETCGVGPCEHAQDRCVAGVPQACDPRAGAVPEACNGVDDDCNGVADDGLGTTTCGTGPCQRTVENCVDGWAQGCTPGPVPAGTCDAPPAACKTTTQGHDACGNPCTKIGPAKCYTVHPACLSSGPGAATDAATCDTPRGNYNCGLTCQEWPNTIGADCTYCVNIYCRSVNGPDVAQFRCRNVPVPPTP